MKKFLILTALGLCLAAHCALAVMTFAPIPAIACDGGNC
jgi:hypothetical protein